MLVSVHEGHRSSQAQWGEQSEPTLAPGRLDMEIYLPHLLPACEYTFRLPSCDATAQKNGVAFTAIAGEGR